MLAIVYCDDVRLAHEAARGLSRAETRAGRVQVVPKRADKERFAVLIFFSRTRTPNNA